MKRVDLTFLTCCCRAFLPKELKESGKNGLDEDDCESDYYRLLGIGRNATQEDIRKAYRKLSLKYHPDKTAQRRAAGISIDEEASRKKFQKIQEAYETIIDPRQREIYNAVGPSAMPYIRNPSSIEFQGMSENLGKASLYDRTKVLLGVIFIFGCIWIQPILICLKVDNDGLENVPWVVLLIPTWIADVLSIVLLLLLYQLEDSETRHLKTLSTSFLKLIAVTAAQICLALKFDETLSCPYSLIFTPLYIFELLRLIDSIWVIRKANKDIKKMVTISFIEQETGKPYADLSDEERDRYNNDYIIVQTPAAAPNVDEEVQSLVDQLEIYQSAEYQEAAKLISVAYGECVSVLFHSILLALVVPRLDNDNISWSWWLVFLPIWIRLFLLCCNSCITICCFNAMSDVDVGVDEEDGEEDEDEESPKNDDVNGAEPTTKESALVAGDVKAEEPNSKVDKEDEKMNGEDQSLSYEIDIKLSVENGKAAEPDVETGGKLSEKETGQASLLIPEKSSELGPESGVQSASYEIDQENSSMGEEDGAEDNEEFQKYWESAQFEDESSAMEATARAAGTCCSILFYLTIVCVFVGKLQQGEDSYSSFWIIFPILLPAGCLCFCLSFFVMCFPGSEALKKNEQEEPGQGQEDEGDAEDNPKGESMPGTDSGLSPIDIENGVITGMSEEPESVGVNVNEKEEEIGGEKELINVTSDFSEID